MCLLYEDKATIIKAVEGEEVRSPSKVWPMPDWIMLRDWRYVTHREPTEDDSARRRAVFNRDGWTCLYCGGPGDTIDHVVPQSRGGRNTYTNLVTACEACNQDKADRTPEEWGVPLLYEPFDPRDNSRMQDKVYKYLKSESGVVG